MNHKKSMAVFAVMIFGYHPWGITQSVDENMLYMPGEALIQLHPMFEPLVLVQEKAGSGEFTNNPSLNQLLDFVRVEQVKSVIPAHQLTKVNSGEMAQVYIIRFPASQDVTEIVATLVADPHIKHATPNLIYRPERSAPSVLPNDYNALDQWGLDRIDIVQAWQVSEGCQNIKIAVVDMGFHLDHPDLAAKFHPVLRYDAVDTDLNPNFQLPIPGEDYLAPDHDPSHLALNSHGTQVSGAAAAETDNGLGIAGTGWRVQIVPVRAGFRYITRLHCRPNGCLDSAECFGNCDGVPDCQCDPNDPTPIPGDERQVITQDNWLRALSWIIANRAADVVNMSFSCGLYSPFAEDMVNAARSSGIVMVASAGNNGEAAVVYPARYDGVIAVGASDMNDQRAGFSNYGEGLSLVAPGVGILTTNGPNTYTLADGTSFSAPIVSATAGLILSVDPSLTPNDVQQLLAAGADHPTGYDPQQLGAGRLNAAMSLSLVASGLAPCPSLCDLYSLGHHWGDTDFCEPQEPITSVGTFVKFTANGCLCSK